MNFIETISYIHQLKDAYQKIYSQLLLSLLMGGIFFLSIESVNIQYCTISLLGGLFLAIYDLFNFSVLMVRFRIHYWGLIESIRYFIMASILIATINTIGGFYIMLLVATYVILKLIFKEHYLQSINRLERLYR